MLNELNLAKLTIKVKALAEEAKIIRVEEKKFQGYRRDVLRDHRIWDVRNEARATQLAVAFMLGKNYKEIEKSCKDSHKFKFYVVPRILAMANKYKNPGHTRIVYADIARWAEEEPAMLAVA